MEVFILLQTAFAVEIHRSRERVPLVASAVGQQAGTRELIRASAAGAPALNS